MVFLFFLTNSPASPYTNIIFRGEGVGVMAVFPHFFIDTLLSDINAIIPNFSSLVSSYRLLVGAAEEIHRIPDVPKEVFNRSVIRFDRCGTLIDILLELLCCKISFSSELLTVTCAPIDLLQMLANRSECEYTPHHTAEQLLQLEVLRRVLEKAFPENSCFGPPPMPPNPPPEPQCKTAKPVQSAPESAAASKETKEPAKETRGTPSERQNLVSRQDSFPSMESGNREIKKKEPEDNIRIPPPTRHRHI